MYRKSHDIYMYMCEYMNIHDLSNEKNFIYVEG